MILVYIASMVIIAIISSLFFLSSRYKEIDDLLTRGEQEWLSENRTSITFGFLEQDFPFEFIESERPDGNFYDILLLLEKNLNVRFNIVYFPNQQERYDALKEGSLDFYLSFSDEAGEGELKTYPVYKIPVISLTLKNRNAPPSQPRKTGIFPGGPVYKTITGNPDFLDILGFNTEILGYSALAEGKIDYFISDLASYYYFRNFFTGPELKINRVFPENIEINAFVNSQNHWLFSILEKASTITLQYSKDWNQSLYSKNLYIPTTALNLNRVSLGIFLCALLFSLISIIFLISHKMLLVDEPNKKMNNIQNTILDGIRTMDSAFILTDKNGFIQYCNNKAETLIASEIKEYLAHPFDSVFHFFNSVGRIDSPLRKTIETMVSHQLPFQSFMFNRNNEKMWISDIFCPLVSKENKISGICIIIHDNSDKNEKEQEIILKEKMETVSRITGNISNILAQSGSEIQNQIINLVRKEPFLENDSYYKALKHNISQQMDNIQLLKSFSQAEELNKSPINIHKIILSIREKITLDLENISLETTLQAISDCVAGSEDSISKLIENLVINAAEAIYPAKGHLVITTENIQLSKQYCTESSFDLFPGDFILVRVIDSGRGINPEIRNSIFEPFFTTKSNRNNKGLGLSKVYQTIVNHSGAIFFYSDKNEGSEFHIFLPICHEHQNNTDQQKNKIKFRGTILVIDDEPVVRDLTKTLLNDMGLHVLTARDGEEGEKIFRLHKHKIKLILLDMIMPNRSGWETYPILKSIDDQIPIVIASGFSISSEVNKILESEGAAFLRKPYRKQELIEVLNQHLPDK